MATNDYLPKKSELMNAIIEMLSASGGSARTAEIDAKVAEAMNLSEEQLSLEDDTSTGTVYSYKMRWARTELRQKGILANPSRGVWTVVAKNL